MPKCFVIQPFDGGKFDKRFKDTFDPAIKDAGLEPYRVDQDPLVEVPIESIEKGIRDAAICLADITTDNPNVWYELGYAFAAGKSVVMVCSDERKESRFPFDIQHRTVIKYQSESSSDFEQLQQEIKKRIEALLTKDERLRQLAESDSVAPIEGLSQPELAVLAELAGENELPEWSLRNAVERAGFTSIGFNLGLRRLLRKEFVESVERRTQKGDAFSAVQLTPTAWDWIEENENLFPLKHSSAQEDDFYDD
ncbi:MAG: hypothetical protein OXF39_03625 [Nitrospira sp.]|nr:hypothetical protein [Nitrospira sp.]